MMSIRHMCVCVHILSVCINIHFVCVCVCAEGVVSLKGVDGKTAYTETVNRQYDYESRAMLEKTLQEQYGQVHKI